MILTYPRKLAYTSLLRITTAPPPAKSSILPSSDPASGTAEEPKRISLASSMEPASDEHGQPHPLADSTPVAGVEGEEMRARERSSFEAAVVSAGNVNTNTNTVGLGGERADERV